MLRHKVSEDDRFEGGNGTPSSHEDCLVVKQLSRGRLSRRRKNKVTRTSDPQKDKTSTRDLQTRGAVVGHIVPSWKNLSILPSRTLLQQRPDRPMVNDQFTVQNGGIVKYKVC